MSPVHQASTPIALSHWRSSVVSGKARVRPTPWHIHMRFTVGLLKWSPKVNYRTHDIGESNETRHPLHHLPTFQLVNARDLMKEHFEPLQRIVPNVVPEGLVLLAGKPKTGKSWLALAITLGIASGRSSLDGCPLKAVHKGFPSRLRQHGGNGRVAGPSRVPAA